MTTIPPWDINIDWTDVANQWLLWQMYNERRVAVLGSAYSLPMPNAGADVQSGRSTNPTTTTGEFSIRGIQDFIESTMVGLCKGWNLTADPFELEYFTSIEEAREAAGINSTGFSRQTEAGVWAEPGVVQAGDIIGWWLYSEVLLMLQLIKIKGYYEGNWVAIGDHYHVGGSGDTASDIVGTNFYWTTARTNAEASWAEHTGSPATSPLALFNGYFPWNNVGRCYVNLYRSAMYPHFLDIGETNCNIRWVTIALTNWGADDGYKIFDVMGDNVPSTRGVWTEMGTIEDVNGEVTGDTLIGRLDPIPQQWRVEDCNNEHTDAVSNGYFLGSPVAVLEYVFDYEYPTGPVGGDKADMSSSSSQSDESSSSSSSSSSSKSSMSSLSSSSSSSSSESSISSWSSESSEPI